MKFSVNSPMEYLAAFGLAFGAGVLMTSAAAAYAEWVRRHAIRR
jgi:hypothetical protein